MKWDHICGAVVIVIISALFWISCDTSTHRIDLGALDLPGIVIVSSSRGPGTEIALQLTKNGYEVVVGVRSEEEKKVIGDLSNRHAFDTRTSGFRQNKSTHN